MGFDNNRLLNKGVFCAFIEEYLDCECNQQPDELNRGGECTPGKNGDWCYVDQGTCTDQAPHNNRFYSTLPCKTKPCVCNGETDVHGHGGSCGEWCFVDKDSSCSDRLPLGNKTISKAVCEASIQTTTTKVVAPVKGKRIRRSKRHNSSWKTVQTMIKKLVFDI